MGSEVSALQSWRVKWKCIETTPRELASNQTVEFYFHIYNILSDPSLNMWMLVPSTISSSVITSGTAFAQSDAYIQIQANNLNGAIVSGTKNNLDFTYAQVNNGYALLPINPEQTGNLTVTITKNNFVPLVATLTPTLSPTLGITGNSLANQIINAGQSYQLELTVKNYSANTINNASANLSVAQGTYVTIQNPSQTITTLAASASTTLTYNFTVTGSTPANSIIRFDLAFAGQSTQYSFDLKTGGSQFAVISSTGNLVIGSTNPVSFTILNNGTDAIQNATVNIYSLTTAAHVVTENVNLGNLAISATAVLQTSIAVESGCFVGRNIPLVFTVTNPSGYQSVCNYTLTAGNPSVTDPTGPDDYGYFAYDSFDVNYPQRPIYQWVEIYPRDGGPANSNVRLIMDDGSYTVNLPFTFRYYGQNYNRMTICSNGWVSFVTTWMADFNNVFIPAPLGPYAMVAPYWDDLKGMKTGEDSLGSYFNNMRICNWYDQANNRYIVEWNDAYNQYTIDLLQNASLEKFQMILYPRNNADGDIVFQYHTVDNPALTTNYSTVGIENHLQNSGLLYSFSDLYPITARPLQAGLAIKITTTPPDNFVSNDEIIETTVPFQLYQNQPNPFMPNTNIEFNVNVKDNVILEIFNLKGQKIRTLHNGVLAKGKHSLVWNGKDDNSKDVSSGIYLYKLTSKGFSQTKKMIMMK